MSSRLNLLRENPATARAGMKWTTEEDNQLMENATCGMKLVDIAIAHKRTQTGVKSRIMANALDLMKTSSMTLDDISKHVNISIQDLENYQQIQKEKLTLRSDKPDIKPQTVEFIESDENDDNNTQKGTAWDKEEENALLVEIDTLTVDEIAALHKRTSGGIRARLRKLGCEMISNGMTVTDASNKVKIPENNLLRSMKLRKTESVIIKKETPNQEFITILTEIRDYLKIIAEK